MRRFIWLLLPLIACNRATNRTLDDELQTRELLRQEQTAHLTRNTDLFLSEFAPGMISVNKGLVKQARPEENRKRIAGYLGSVEFQKWDDTAEPLIRVSKDGSLAYAVIQKKVILSRQDSTGIRKMDTTDYAWASIYRKMNGEWKVECNASTTKELP